MVGVPSPDPEAVSDSLLRDGSSDEDSHGSRGRCRRGRLASVTAVADSRAAIDLARRLRGMEADVQAKVE